MDQKRNDDLRWKSHSYELSNQAVIELAYCVKDLLERTGDGRPSFEQANCRNAVRELIGRGMLPQVDDEYKRMHADVVSFCLGNQPTRKASLAGFGQESSETAVNEHLKAVPTGIAERSQTMKKITEDGAIKNNEAFGITELAIAFDEVSKKSKSVDTLLEDLTSLHLPKLEGDVQEYLAMYDAQDFDALAQIMAFKYRLNLRDAFFFLAGGHTARAIA